MGAQRNKRQEVVVLGAGRIGRCIATLLSQAEEFEVILADRNDSALSQLQPSIQTCVVDVCDEQSLFPLLQGKSAVISACQYRENPQIARGALLGGASYFDLTEDVQTTQLVRALSASAQPGQVFVPQCGLAPGYIGILGAAMAARFDSLDTLKLRVGALPELPSNSMLYNLTWSTEGLINEYVNACAAIKHGKICQVQALEGLETLSLSGGRFEAFNTSGGLGTLCETMQGRVRELTYKTIRYPGHRVLMDFLINGLRLGEAGERRELLKKIFEEAVPITAQGIVLILVEGTGQLDGKLGQMTEYHRVVHGAAFDSQWSAIQITTASSLCVVVDLFLQGGLQGCGFVAQEEIPYEKFMKNRWAKAYEQSAHLWGSEHGVA